MEQFGKINLDDKQLKDLKTPCYILNEDRIEDNCKILADVQKTTGCKIILALKGFAAWYFFPLIHKYLPGIAASSVNEALLGKEKFGGEVHVYAPAYSGKDIKELVKLAHHISFNSVSQWNKYKDFILSSYPSVRCGLRINPEHSEVKTALYDPCAPHSRLGITLDEFKKNIDCLDGISGLHFHNLCELNSDALERTLQVVEKKFGFYFDKIQWINFGGGHHISRPDYTVSHLTDTVNRFKQKYSLEVILEPGEAIALNTGVLVSEVMDIIENKKNIAILDTSATAHMPDVLEMPYRPFIMNGYKANEKPYTYRLGGLTCLAGDVIGDYSFNQPLQCGDKLIFGDMAHYTMVKNTAFNGVNLPAIYAFNSKSGQLRLIKEFGYEDYKNRLG